MIPDTFSWRGWTVGLGGIRDGAGAWVWTAQIDGTDYLYVAGGRPDDDVELVKHHVRDWIDRGMPNGGPAS